VRRARGQKEGSDIVAKTDGAVGTAQARLRREARRFQAPILSDSLFQLITSFGGLFATCAAMYALAGLSLWLPPLLAPLAAGFLVRIFIIQHDCGHHSFVASRRINNVIGAVCSLLTLTPYSSWRRQHAGHHGVWNDLDRRHSGADIYSSCLTVDEYRGLSRLRRFWYRATRHPLVANVILPPFVFLILYRLPFDMPKSWRRERRMVHLTTLAAIAWFVGQSLVFGLVPMLVVQLPALSFAAIIGVWLFTVQHRSEGTLWARHAEWSQTSASLRGSSYLCLPTVLKWFTGNIGFHHVHHMDPRVPNYRLEECHDALAMLRGVPQTSLWQGMKDLRFILWDEDRSQMIRVGAASGLSRAAVARSTTP
jgi:omega-6 fatty acid desaturase (delta-12 desaturase)